MLANTLIFVNTKQLHIKLQYLQLNKQATTESSRWAGSYEMDQPTNKPDQQSMFNQPLHPNPSSARPHGVLMYRGDNHHVSLQPDTPPAPSFPPPLPPATQTQPLFTSASAGIQQPSSPAPQPPCVDPSLTGTEDFARRFEQIKLESMVLIFNFTRVVIST